MDAHTVSRPISEQNKSEIWVNANISLAFGLGAYSSAIRKTHFIMTGKASENGADVLRRFIRFVDNNDSTMHDSSEEW